MNEYILYYIILYYILYYIILYDMILYYIILYYIILYYILLYSIIFYYIILYYIKLYYIIVYYILFFYIILYYILLYSILFYYIILYYIIVYYIIVYYIKLYIYNKHAGDGAFATQQGESKRLPYQFWDEAGGAAATWLSARRFTQRRTAAWRQKKTAGWDRAEIWENNRGSMNQFDKFGLFCYISNDFDPHSWPALFGNPSSLVCIATGNARQVQISKVFQNYGCLRVFPPPLALSWHCFRFAASSDRSLCSF